MLVIYGFHFPNTRASMCGVYVYLSLGRLYPREERARARTRTLSLGHAGFFHMDASSLYCGTFSAHRIPRIIIIEIRELRKC